MTVPDGRMAWFPATAAGRARLVRERRVLRLLAERCSVRVPKLLFEPDSGFDLRAIVLGRCDRTLADDVGWMRAALGRVER